MFLSDYQTFEDTVELAVGSDLSVEPKGDLQRSIRTSDSADSSSSSSRLHYSRRGKLRRPVHNKGWLNFSGFYTRRRSPGPTFIKPDQLDPWINDQIKITLLPTISHLLLPNFVSCGRACPSHMTQNLVTVGAKLWTADCFLVDPWSMDYADPVW